MSKARQVIVKSAKQLILDIRAYALDQVEIWKTIPTLAHKAYGRSGYSDNHSRAIYDKLWAVKGGASGGMYMVLVCLETGRLVDPYNTSKQAGDEYVLRLVLCLEELDAKLIADDLKQQAKEVRSPHIEPMTGEQKAKLRQALSAPATRGKTNAW